MALVPETSTLFSILSAELLMIILRARDITVLLKTKQQRTAKEQREVNQGLLRSIALEIFLFIPASVVLFTWICRPFALKVERIKILVSTPGHAFDGLLGIISYVFPFAVVRRIVSETALRTLRNFAQIVLEDSSKTAGT